ncbi:ATP-binding protein [Sorangium sp. So ce1153]|uniref:ATP-binding protein n=1 Tax=Sorangium sp. So ce1153 TaxID=3133333 RepID=UPI003F5FCCBD
MNAPLMKHNPAFLTPEQLRSSFVVRRRDLDIVLRYIRDSTGPSNQHVLVLGSRGMGKTTLVRMLADTVARDPELGARWYPLLFGEESYTVSTIGELWLEAIMHLGDQTGDARWQALHDELRAERDDDRLCARALAQLVGFAEEQGKRILLIIENLHMLLDEQMSKKDAWSLRHTLQNEPRILLLATATSRFGAILDEEQALYEMFATYALEPLDLTECRALWEVVGGVEASERRVRPMQILTGGNPRLLGILASFAAKTSLRHLMENLAQLVDENTDYFKSHLERLPPTERKVYVMLADLWAPSTAREVAEAARMEVNQASALLHRLVGRGAVVEAVVEEGRGRRVRYRLSERLYNVYHLLRRRGAGAARVQSVVDFMVHFYEEDGLAGLLGRIAKEAKGLGPEERTDHLNVIEGILERIRDAKLRRELVDSLIQAGVLSWPDVSEGLKKKLGRVLFVEAARLNREGQSPLAGRLLVMSPGLSIRMLGAALLGASGLWDEAFTAVEQVLSSKVSAVSANVVLDLLVDAVAAGHVDRALTLLEGSPARISFEPLLVALRQIAGQSVQAPPEVLEVASDLVRLIEQQRQAKQQKASDDADASGSPLSAVMTPRRAGKGRAASGK